MDAADVIPRESSVTGRGGECPWSGVLSPRLTNRRWRVVPGPACRGHRFGAARSANARRNRVRAEPERCLRRAPGHDAWTVGDEPCVQIEWAGMRAWAGYPTGIRSRVLGTLLFTDLVASTETAAMLGDSRWRELLSTHFKAARAELERFGGREVKTRGHGMLALFDGTARALCTARRRFGRRRFVRGSRSERASTSATSSLSGRTSVVSLSARRRGSWLRRAQTRFSL